MLWQKIISFFDSKDVISLLISVVTAYVTSKLTLCHDQKKEIYTRREEVYAELFDLLQRLKNEPSIQFNRKEFILPFENLRPRINLFASQNIVNKSESIYDEVKTTFDEYCRLFDGEEYVMQKIIGIQNGKTELEFDQQEEMYINNHLLEPTQLAKTIDQLVADMRKDIGSK